MARERIVINGYAVPWGKSGIAVRKACEIVLEEPGIPQGDLMERCAKFSGLSVSNSTWLVSPGATSPATILWERKRIGRKYHCYPNDFTCNLSGATEYKVTEWLRSSKKCVRGNVLPKRGDIVEVTNMRIYVPCPIVSGKALFLGWTDGRDFLTETLEEFGEKREYRSVTVPLLMMEGNLHYLRTGKIKVVK